MVWIQTRKLLLKMKQILEIIGVHICIYLNILIYYQFINLPYVYLKKKNYIYIITIYYLSNS